MKSTYTGPSGHEGKPLPAANNNRPWDEWNPATIAAAHAVPPARPNYHGSPFDNDNDWGYPISDASFRHSKPFETAAVEEDEDDSPAGWTLADAIFTVVGTSLVVALATASVWLNGVIQP